jgi:hypothetical protein
LKPVQLALLFAVTASAHVGSPDVYFDGKAGPYPLFVTIRPPAVIPGVAEVEIRSESKDVSEVWITPSPLTGPGAKYAPVADRATRHPNDPQFYTGNLWMMSSGAWQIRIRVKGSQGEGALAVPVPNAAKRTLQMDQTMAGILLALMAFLVTGAVAIAGAAVREAPLRPGVTAGSGEIRKGRVVMLAAAVLVALMVWGGNAWWKSEASAYDRYIYKPIQMKSQLVNGGMLRLEFEHGGWLQERKFDDLIEDHGKLMHLYVIRQPDLDRVWHLHPEMTGPGVFERALPAMPAGTYKLYADIVHKNGFPETLVSEIVLPAVPGAPLGVDDVEGRLSEGVRMVFENRDEPLIAKRPTRLRFHLENAKGEVIRDLGLYLGMPGHAAVVKKGVKTEGAVFAHLHPTGTVAMASLALAAGDPHAGHYMGAIPPTVSFPYGFPEPGDYRLFVQMKQGNSVETAWFDVSVKP